MTNYRGGQVQQDENERQMCCSKCFTPTPRATLGDFGSQCFPCFSAYLRETPRHYRAGKPDTPTVADMKTRVKARIA